VACCEKIFVEKLEARREKYTKKELLLWSVPTCAPKFQLLYTRWQQEFVPFPSLVLKHWMFRCGGRDRG